MYQTSKTSFVPDKPKEKGFKFFRYKAKKQSISEFKHRWKAEIHINGKLAMRVFRDTEEEANRLAAEVCAYLKLKQVQHENRKNKK